MSWGGGEEGSKGLLFSLESAKTEWGVVCVTNNLESWLWPGGVRPPTVPPPPTHTHRQAVPSLVTFSAKVLTCRTMNRLVTARGLRLNSPSNTSGGQHQQPPRVLLS